MSVRRLLLEGDLLPGQRIKQGELATRLGVSPVPVREALRVLQSEGLAVHQPGRGFWVAKLDYEDVVELDLMARLFEHEAFKRGVPLLNEDDISRMTELFEEMKRGFDGEDVWRQAMIHRELHFVPVRAAGLPRLTAELERLWEHTDHHRVLYLFKAPTDAKEAVRQHGELIGAAAGGDPADVIRVQDAHRDFALEHIRRVWSEENETPETAI